MDENLVVSGFKLALGGTSLLNLDFNVEAAQVLTVMGPSGSGKSSLLAWMTGHLSTDFKAQGKVILNGNDLTNTPHHRRNIGILFQDPLLFPHMSVGQNIAFGLQERGDRQAAIKLALEEVDLGGFEDRDPATLSGGQKARVALMRALVAKPKALLLDEPFSKLDSALRDSVRSLVFQRVRERSIPTVLVTHDESDAIAAGGPVIRLE